MVENLAIEVPRRAKHDDGPSESGTTVPESAAMPVSLHATPVLGPKAPIELAKNCYYVLYTHLELRASLMESPNARQL